MRVHDQEVTFNVFKAMKFSNDAEEWYRVDIGKGVVNGIVLGSYTSDPLESAKVYKKINKVFLHGAVPIEEADSKRAFKVKRAKI